MNGKEARRRSLLRLKVAMKKEILGVLDSHARRRPFRAAFYTCLGAGGVILVWDPTASLQEAEEIIRWVWGGFLIVGGLVSLYGVVRDKWPSECLGILPITTAFVAFIAILFVGGNTGSVAVGLFFVALVIVLAGRFMDLYFLGRATIRMSRRMGVE